MAAVEVDLIGDNAIDQGSKFSQAFILGSVDNPRDLSGFSIRAKMREDFSDAVAAADFEASIRAPETDGYLSIALGATVTAALEPGMYRYDIELFSAGDADDVEMVVRGAVEVRPEVTK